MKIKPLLFLSFIGLFLFSHSFAEAQQNVNPYNFLVKQELERSSVSPEYAGMPTEFQISSAVRSGKRTIVYVQHTINNIPVRDAITIMSFDNRDALKFKRISKEMKNINALQAPSFYMTEENAIDIALDFIGKSEDEVVNAAPDFISRPINLEKAYLMENGDLIPVYQVEVFIDLHRTDIVTIDAGNSEILMSRNKVLECNSIVPSQGGNIMNQDIQSQILSDSSAWDYQYNVAPLPDINVIEKGRRLIESPADEIASEIGWHNVEGVLDGPENILEGNNVLVNIDRMGNWGKEDTVYSDPAGVFDFPLDLSKEPEEYTYASMTQLFVVNNQIHDILYHNYFDEEAGNFQRLNFQGGSGDDPVIVFGQSGAGNPQGGRNNALFYPSPDGEPGYMVMFVWGFENGAGLTVLEPESIAGVYESSGATFTPDISTHPVKGYVVIADDGEGEAHDACQDLINEEEIAGNIALIYRGSCNFDEKVQRAEAAGAIAVIIVNLEGDNLIQMSGSIQASIPAIMVGRTAGLLFINNIDSLYISLGPDENEGPTYRDGALDNTIPIHEYGHGVSSRLVGGPASVDCLWNDEQMGEGWSDILAIIMTMSDDNYTLTDRAMGSYAFNNEVNDGGIRRKTYSPDFTVNNYTYKDTYYSGSGPHALGEIWATFLWDLVVELVDLEGFDVDLMYGNGGNRIALQLIIEGMKYTECGPGMVDGRDGILAADEALFDGKYSCLIWDVFARRGLGYYANQESSQNRKEGIEDFNGNPYCDARVKVSKTVQEYAAPGDTVEVLIQIFNHAEGSSQNVQLSDQLPEGGEFIASTGEVELELINDELYAEINDFGFNDTVSLSYTYVVNKDKTSEPEWIRLFEEQDSFSLYFTGENLGTGNSSISWNEFAGKGNSGAALFLGLNNSDQVLVLNEPILVDIDNPILVVEHASDIRLYESGAFFEYSMDGEKWDIIDTSLVNGKYNYKMRGGDIPDHYQYAYSGKNDWTKTVIDLSGWQGQEVHIRLRLSTNVFGREEWAINEVSYWNRLSYNPEVCITTENYEDCFAAPGYGTIIFGDTDTTSVSVINLDPEMVLVHPQPFQGSFTVKIPEEIGSDIQSVRFFNMDGVMFRQIEGRVSESLIINADGWTPGVYFMQINTSEGRLTKKLIKH